MNRRSFLGAILASAVLDPERLLWRPGAKLISIPKPQAPVTSGWSASPVLIRKGDVIMIGGGQYRVTSTVPSSIQYDEQHDIVSIEQHALAERVGEPGSRSWIHRGEYFPRFIQDSDQGLRRTRRELVSCAFPAVSNLRRQHDGGSPLNQFIPISNSIVASTSATLLVPFPDSLKILS
jgi:hypothetical protein